MESENGKSALGPRITTEARVMNEIAGSVATLPDVTSMVRVAKWLADHCAQVAGDDVLSMRIDDVGLSYRIRNHLARAGVTTVRELVKLSADNLLDFPFIGVTSLNEIREFLTMRGLALSGEEKTAS